MRFAAVAALLVLSCNRDVRPAPPSGPATEATLFFTSELEGYLGPCGCSENMRGGIDRAAFQLAEARKSGKPVLLIDTGDTLFGTPTIAEEAVAQQERKAKTLAQAMTLMGLAAKVNGPLDDARGAEFRKSLALPELPSDTLKSFELAGHRVVVISSAKGDTLFTLAAQARAAKASVIVGLFEGPVDEALRFTQRDGLELDLLLATRGRDALSTETNRLVMTHVPVVQLQSKGRSLLRVELFLREGAKVQWLKSPSETQRELEALSQRIELLRAQVNDPSLGDELKVLKKAKLEEVIARREALASEQVPVPTTGSAASVRIVPLETSFEKLPAATELVKAYDRDVGEANLAWAKQHGVECETPEPGKPSYVGTEICRACHPAAYDVWKQTKHAKAHEALVAEGKNNHLDCVTCHLTGWKERGGVCRLDQVEGKTHVGCESCHGPGSSHLSLPVKTTIFVPKDATACVSCHDRENSPHFDLEKYLPKLIAPGHGLPMPVVDAGVVEVPDAGAPAKPVKKPHK